MFSGLGSYFDRKGPSGPSQPVTTQVAPVAPVVPDAGIVSLPAADTTVANPVVQQTLTTPAPVAPVVTPFTPLRGEELLTSWATLPQQDTYDLTQFSKLTPQKIERAQEIAAKVFGRELTPAELYQVGQGYTGSNLQNTIKLLNETQDINQFYQDVYGRAAKPEEIQSGTKMVSWKNEQDKLLKNLGGTEEALSAKVFGANNDLSAKEIQDFVNANQADPYVTYAAANKFGVTPEEITIAMRATGKNATGMINSYTNAKTVDEAFKAAGLDTTSPTFNQYYTDLQKGKITPQEFTTKFFDEQLTNLANFEAARANVTGDPFTDAAIAAAYTPKNISSLYQYTTNQTLNNVLGEKMAGQYSTNSSLINDLVTGKITRQQFEERVQNSSANVNQEAARLADLYTSISGGSQADFESFYNALIGKGSGSGVDQELLGKAKEQLKNSLASESLSTKTRLDIIDEAADKPGAQQSKFFQKNPELFYAYSPLQKVSDDPNYLYGNVNGAPVYDAKAVDEYIAKITGDPDATIINSFAHRSSDRKGIEVGGNLQGGSGFVKRGAGVVGLSMAPEVDGDGNPTGRYTVTGNINDAAKKAGIDIADYKPTYKEVPVLDEFGQPLTERVKENGKFVTKPVTEKVVDKTVEQQVFDAVNDIYKDTYVIGTVNPKNPKEKSENNFIYTAYRKTDDGKLVPVSAPTTYTGAINPDVYKKKGVFGGGWLGETVQGIASIPFIAEMTMLAMNAAVPGSGTAAYPFLKAGQTAAYTTDFGDIAKTGGTAYLATQLPNVVAPEIGGALEGIEGLSPQTTKFLTNLGTGATTAGGIAALQGADIKSAIADSALGTTITGGINTLLPEVNNTVKQAFDLTDDQARIFTNTLARLAPTILTGGEIDPTKLVMNALISQSMNQIKEDIKKGGSGRSSESSSDGLQSLMTSDSGQSKSAGVFPEEVQSWIDSAETPQTRRYRESIAYKFGMAEKPVSDTEFSPENRSGVNTMGYDPKVAAYMIEQFDNMIARPDENANLTGSNALKQRLGEQDIRI